MDNLTQESEDAVVTLVLQRLAHNGHYRAVMDEMTPEERELVEACVERHAARMRAKGEPGW